MPSASTRRALATRAVKAAGQIEYWVKTIQDDVSKRNPNVDWTRATRESTLLVSQNLLMNTLYGMGQLAAEIRQFAPKDTIRRP